MPSYDYSNLDATATRLIARFGRTITLVTQSVSGDAWNPTLTDSTQEATGVQVFPGQSNLGINDRNLWLAEEDERYYLFDSAIEITTDMMIRDGGYQFEIASVVELKPGDTSMIYKVMAKGKQLMPVIVSIGWDESSSIGFSAPVSMGWSTTEA